MTIEHSNGTIPQPAASDIHTDALPDFDSPTYVARTYADLRAERQRTNRRFTLASFALLAVIVAYFVSAAFAPTVALAAVAADALAAVIYLCGGLSIGYLVAQAHKQHRGRRQ